MNTIQSISAISAAVLAVALSACGASEPAPVQPTPAPAADPATPVVADDNAAAKPHHEEGEHDFPAAVTAFHDLMAPKWHAEPGAQRQTDTCGALASFKAAADQIGKEPVPEKASAQEGRWHNAVADLNISINGLENACNVDGRPDFQASFHEVHEAFHRLVALVGHEKHEEGHEDHGKHKGHGEHHDHGKHKGHDKH